MTRSISTVALWIVLIGAGVLLFHPALVQAQASRTVSETVRLDRDGEVQLSAFTGEITVNTWDRAAVQIDVRIEGDEQEYVDKTQIRIDGSGRRVTIETDYDELEKRFLGLFDLGGDEDRPPTFYTLTMPATAALSIEDFSSDIEVTGLRNGLDLDTFSSTVRLRDIEGPIEAETYSSDVTAEDVAGSIRFETFSGDATIGARTLTDDCRFESFSGDIELLLPADAGFDLDAELGMGGDFTSDFALDNVDTEGNEYRGSVNGGGPRIRFETFSGDLAIRRR